MKIRMIKNDIRKNKAVAIILFVFIMMASVLTAAAAGMIGDLTGAMEELLQRSQAPHFIQMHNGEVDQAQLDDFAREHEDLIKDVQVVTLLNIEGAQLFIGDTQVSEAGSVMENAFVKQNESFDFLLGSNLEKLDLAAGEIAVPVYHMQEYGLQAGDQIEVRSGTFKAEFTLVDFAKDGLMNPSLVTSKRFLVSDEDWERLSEAVGEREYIIEIQLYNETDAAEVQRRYQEAGLPDQGTALDYSLIKQINALTDGITAAVILFIAMLLIGIAFLCLRLSFLAVIEEDYREIGVMKAVGIAGRDIRRLYMMKYTVIAGSAALGGWLLSLPLRDVFGRNIMRYMGAAERNMTGLLVPAAGSLLVFLTVVILGQLILRRFRRISAAEAIRSDGGRRGEKGSTRLSIDRYYGGDINIFLGIREVLRNIRAYGILVVIYITAVCLMIIPLNFYTTLRSSEFITYMGAGECDLRIDVQQGSDIEALQGIIEHVHADPDVARSAVLQTGILKVAGAAGDYESVHAETGELEVFPVQYIQGSGPEYIDEIALSSLLAEELGKTAGDSLTVLQDGISSEWQVSGIYQDMTNGGKTAKMKADLTADEVIWATINLELQENIEAEVKQKEYEADLGSVKVTAMEDYIIQTLGTLLDSLGIIVLVSAAVAMLVTILITALFFQMLRWKEREEIRIMRSLGFHSRHIRKQYMTRGIMVLLTGIVIGTLIAMVLGEQIAALVLAGVSSLKFVVNPWISYLLCPAVLVLVTGLTIIVDCRSISGGRR